MSSGFICGLDEAGRGPLAGPVVAAAVVFPKDFPHEILCALNDSKKMSEIARLNAEPVIKENAFWGTGSASHAEIDEINILQASLLAMRRSFENMLAKGVLDETVLNGMTIIADGLYVPHFDAAFLTRHHINLQALVKADSKVHEVMAASILAKCERDRIMCDYDKLYPAYGYAKHKGYPTLAHRTICKEKGFSPIQRKTFTVR